MAEKNQQDIQEDAMMNEEQPLTEEGTEAADVESVSSDAEENAADPASEKINELEQKLAESENRYLRLRADFDNLRRRTQIEKEASEKYRAQSLIAELLPLVDNFDRALKIEATNEQTQSLLQGMEMVYKGIIAALEKEGVKAIEAVGSEFDPNFHQAVMTDSVEGYESNVVVEEFQKGFMLKDRVIRPSMVKVNQ
ncbi:molecular chaperone GrpE [Bacillus ectoiniformans]|uniref:nucleotide exchange factor GrpE n=1 Tax=Bacillus ectoiniformans TaxID=1494429 RepID=UPI00195F2294|nr:nucleotide exchange factor GrpE [Bacillus ectoiniformans]MBM7649983.1 molecular chaperone GrpE [Bacillus ectoiniformans]